MNIKFNTKESKITEHGIETMENKINLRFNRILSNVSDEELTFHVKVVDKKLQYKVELTLNYMGYTLRAETYDKLSSIAALDKAMDIMERQIVKVKTKLSRVKNQVPEFKGEATATDEDAEPANYEVVRVKSYEMKPISVQEAIMNMNLLGHTFYTFLNRETDKISTVYKRKDGDYGLIEPQ